MATETVEKRGPIQRYWPHLATFGIAMPLVAAAACAAITGASAAGADKLKLAAAGLLCAAAPFAAAFILGFLFGIPRTLQEVAAVQRDRPSRCLAPTASGDRDRRRATRASLELENGANARGP